MTVELLAAGLLIAVPIAFNVAFFELGRSFDYPYVGWSLWLVGLGVFLVI
jgi:hypothetical protein